MVALTAVDIPGHNNIAGPGKDEPLFAHEKVGIHRPDGGDGGGHARSGAAPLPNRRCSTRADEAILDLETALASGPKVQAPSTILVGDPDAAMKSAPSSQWRIQRRRSGAFLSRKPDRLRLARRGRRPVVHSLDPAPDRGAARLRRAVGLRLQSRDGGGASVGGGFGGKESNASSSIAGRRPCRGQDRPAGQVRLPPREIDMLSTDTASSTATRWASMARARAKALDAVLAADAGWSPT